MEARSLGAEMRALEGSATAGTRWNGCPPIIRELTALTSHIVSPAERAGGVSSHTISMLFATPIAFLFPSYSTRGINV